MVDDGARPVVRGRHRAAAGGRPEAGRRARRRTADRRAHGPPGHGAASSATACGSPTPTPSTSPGWCSAARSTATSCRPSTATTGRPSACSGEDAGLIVARQRDADLGYVGDVVDVDRPDPRHAAPRRLHPGHLHHRDRRRAGRPTTSTPTAPPSPSPRSCGAEKLIYLTDVPGVLTDVDDPSSLVSRLTAARARLLIADGVIAGGMIPKIEACLGAVEAGVGSAHILDGRIPHVVLLELLTDAGVGTMITRTDGELVTTTVDHARPVDARPGRSTAARSCRPTAPPSLMLVRGEGSPPVGRRRPGVPRLPVRARRHEPRPRAPGGRRGAGRAGAARSSTCRTCSAPSTAGRWPRPSTGCSAAAGRSSSPTRGPRPTSARSSWPGKFGRPRSPRRGERARLVPRPDARHAPRHRPAREARALPAAPRGLPPRRLERPRRARRRARPDGRGGAARAGAGRGRGQPGDRRVLRGRAPAVRRAGHPLHGRRGADRPRPHRPVVRPPALRRRPRRRHDGQGPRQRRARSVPAGPGPTWPPRSSPATTPPPTAASPSPPPRPAPSWPRWRPRTCPPGPPAGRGPAQRRARRRSPGVAAVRGLGPARRRRARRPRRPGGRRRGAGRRADRQRGHPDRPSARAVRCSSPTTRSTRPAAILGAALDPRWRPDDPPPARDRRPQPRRAGAGARPAAAPGPAQVLAGRGAALLFEKPSLRTRHSTEMAVVQLGGHPVSVRPDEVGIDVRETAEDVARTLAGYHAAIGARVFEHATLERMAAAGRRAGREPALGRQPPAPGHRRPAHDPPGVRAARGPHRRVGGRLLQRRPVAGAGGRGHAGMAVRFACPPGYGPTDADLDRMRAVLGRGRGGHVVRRRGREGRRRRVDRRLVLDGPGGRGRGAAAGLRGLRRRRRRCSSGRASGPSSCTACPPTGARRSPPTRSTDPRSRVFVQAANRMHAARGALAFLMTESEA